MVAKDGHAQRAALFLSCFLAGLSSSSFYSSVHEAVSQALALPVAQSVEGIELGV
jgi:hypothetical protein